MGRGKNKSRAARQARSLDRGVLGAQEREAAARGRDLTKREKKRVRAEWEAEHAPRNKPGRRARRKRNERGYSSVPDTLPNDDPYIRILSPAENARARERAHAFVKEHFTTWSGKPNRKMYRTDWEPTPRALCVGGLSDEAQTRICRDVKRVPGLRCVAARCVAGYVLLVGWEETLPWDAAERWESKRRQNSDREGGPEYFDGASKQDVMGKIWDHHLGKKRQMKKAEEWRIDLEEARARREPEYDDAEDREHDLRAKRIANRREIPTEELAYFVDLQNDVGRQRLRKKQTLLEAEWRQNLRRRHLKILHRRAKKPWIKRSAKGKATRVPSVIPPHELFVDVLIQRRSRIPLSRTGWGGELDERAMVGKFFRRLLAYDEDDYLDDEDDPRMRQFRLRNPDYEDTDDEKENARVRGFFRRSLRLLYYGGISV